MAQMKIDLEQMHNIITSYDTYLENTDSHYITPLLTAVEECGFVGTEAEKISSMVEEVTTMYKKLKEHSLTVNENTKTVLLRFTGISEDDYTKFVKDQASESVTSFVVPQEARK